MGAAADGRPEAGPLADTRPVEIGAGFGTVFAVGNRVCSPGLWALDGSGGGFFAAGRCDVLGKTSSASNSGIFGGGIDGGRRFASSSPSRPGPEGGGVGDADAPSAGDPSGVGRRDSSRDEIVGCRHHGRKGRDRGRSRRDRRKGRRSRRYSDFVATDTREGRSLDGGAECDDFVRVNAPCRGFLEVLLDLPNDERHSRRAADENDSLDLVEL
jgi:hypothetical protein